MEAASANTGVVLATLIAYKAALIAIGLWASRRMHDEADFLIGGRGLGPIVAGLSYAASTSSAWVLLGFSGFVYTVGLSALWMVPGILLGYVVVWMWFGPRLRAEAAERGHVTLTDFLAGGSGASAKRAIAVVASALILFCFVFYVAAQFQAAGRAFAETFGIGITESVLIGAAIVVVYALLGGFWAVSVTDTLQGLVMAGVALLVPAAALIAAGGPAEVWRTLEATAPPGFLDPTGGRVGLVFAGFALGIFSVGLGTYGQPHLLNRLMAVRSDGARRAGFAIAFGWAVAVYTGMTVLALAGRALAPDLGNAENIFYRMTTDLLPAMVAGVVIAAILSAVMSTVDSILLAAAGAVSHDLGLARRRPQTELTVARVVMALIAGAAVVMTLTIPATIFERVLFAWSALGAAFGPIVVARVCGVEPKAWAIVAAMVIGFALTAAFNQVLPSGPGAIGERLLPWLPTLALVFLVRQPRRASAGLVQETSS